MDDRARQDLAESVLGDLKWLCAADLKFADEALLRELSARLRRLLVEGSLQRFRTEVANLRGEPLIGTPPPLEPASSDVAYAQLGGGQRSGVTLESVTVWNRALGPEEVKERYEEGMEARRRPRQLRLSRWLSETCIHVSGVTASRRDVIKFVANKLGGVHIDSRRDLNKFPGYGALDRGPTARGATTGIAPATA